MPREYEHIRDSYVKAGKSYDEAQRLAAMTYNKNHPGKPMHPQDEMLAKMVKRK